MRLLLLVLLTLVALPASATYTKIANNGSDLSATATLGSTPTAWACTRDNASGLLWEVKTTDHSGLRDMTKTYTNYDDPTQAQIYNGGSPINPTQAEIDAASNSIGLVNEVNATALCGYTDWRMPTKEELLGLVTGSTAPTIDATFFPNTPSSYFWSGSPYASNSYYEWCVFFYFGGVHDSLRYFDNQVRLVRGGQSIGTFVLTISATGNGSIADSHSSIACTSTAGVTTGTCSASPLAGTTALLTATPAAGSGFSGWSGGVCSGTSPNCMVPMGGRKSVTANFALAPKPTTNSIVIDPVTPTTLYAAVEGAGVYQKMARSNWVALNSGLSNLFVKALTIKADSSVLYAGTDGGGVFYKTGSGNWAACANTGTGMTNLHIRSLLQADRTLYAGTEGGVFTSSNGCATWTALNNGLPN
jgi:hypothetical protein